MIIVINTDNEEVEDAVVSAAADLPGVKSMRCIIFGDGIDGEARLQQALDYISEQEFIARGGGSFYVRLVM